jgi:hypothetical protein
VLPDPEHAFHFYMDQDPNFHSYADPDTDPSFQIMAQNLEKMLKYPRLIFTYILACHRQIDEDPDPDTAHHFEADADADPAYHFDADAKTTFQFDADPDTQHCYRVR